MESGDYLGIVTFDYINKIISRCVISPGKSYSYLVQPEKSPVCFYCHLANIGIFPAGVPI